MRTILFEIYDFLPVYFNSIDWQQVILPFKILCLFISGLLLLIVVFLIVQLRRNIKKSLKMVAASVLAPGLPKKTMTKK